MCIMNWWNHDLPKGVKSGVPERVSNSWHPSRSATNGAHLIPLKFQQSADIPDHQIPDRCYTSKIELYE